MPPNSENLWGLASRPPSISMLHMLIMLRTITHAMTHHYTKTLLYVPMYPMPPSSP